MANIFTRTWLHFYDSLNFFRIHVLFFTFTPLITASIFYAANGKYPVPFIDALFNCVSAITVTGLATVDLSKLTGFQQAILFVQMCMGSPVVVSWIIVYTRRRFFQNKLSHIIAEELKRERQGGIIAAMRERTISISRSLSRDHNNSTNPPLDPPEKTSIRPRLFRRLANRMHHRDSPNKSPSSTVSGAATPSSNATKRKGGLAQRLRTDMIRRIETAPQRVNPMGGIGGVVVSDDGGKGKGREHELDGHHYEEKHDGGEVYQVATGSSGSRTRYGSNNSPNHESQPLPATPGARADLDTFDDMSGDISRSMNGTISTPTRPGYDVPPPQMILSPPTADGFHSAPSVESPRPMSDTGSGILRRTETYNDRDTVTDEDAATHPESHGTHGLIPRSGSRDQFITDVDDANSPRAGAPPSPVRFSRPPPIRVTPGTLGDERVSPNPSRARETDHVSVSFSGHGHDRRPSEAITVRETGTGDLPRTQTIEFASPPTPHARGRTGTRRPSAGVASERERERARFRNFTMGSTGANPAPVESDGDANSLNMGASSHGHGRVRGTSANRQRMGSVSNAYFPRTATGRSYGTTRLNPNVQVPSNQSGFGGFPMPHELAGRVIKKYFPKSVTLTRTLTGGSGGLEPRQVPYITFDAIVGRNSQFHDLSPEEQEELGGVEYRALGALLWIVGGYHLLTQLFAFVVFAPYMNMSKWAPVFEQQWRYVPPTWFAAFQAVSAYTNTGMSLVDQSMVPFQTAYPMIIIIFFLILAGNTAFPICLRFVIWVLSKLVGKRTHETLSFLLDHPRRCFIYLFPSHQTWFLLIILLSMIITDWVSFMVLDIGNDVIEAIPVGTRLAIGLLQASAVRAAGFATVSISALAPAVKVLYVTMMYVAVYPIALSVRATNVYEEQSLGIYLDEDEKDEEEPNPSGGRINAWGNYIAWHARKQLSFDMWWLAVALWLLCIIERAEIVNPDHSWFDIFTIIFELVSAYGTVGLSIGLPNANYSFSGALKPLSKLVICIVMLRGRHRSLPHAIDRAVVLPREYVGEPASPGFSPSGNRHSTGAEIGASSEAHTTSRAPAHGVDLKHRTNTLLSPVHEVLTPVTSLAGTPRPTFASLSPGN